MPRFVLALPAVAGLAVGLSVARAAEPVHVHGETFCDGVTHKGCGKAAIMRQRFLEGGSPTGEGPGWNPDQNVFEDREALGDTDVLNNNLDIAIDPATSNISGSNTITLQAVNNISQFTFMLRNNYTVSSILVNGVSVAIPANPPAGNYARTITLNRVYLAGETLTIKITYSGTAVNVGLGSIFFTTQNGVPLVSSLSQPYYAATWWPCKDGNVQQPGDNIDKATWTFALTTPSNLVGVSNGVFQGVDTLPDGRKKWRYQSNLPMATYLACFSATNYNIITTPYSWTPPGGGTPVSFNFKMYLYPNSDTVANRNNWLQVLPMMDAFQPVFGAYPFASEGYGMYQFPFSGGMEHQTMTGQGVFITSITAHELGHQWWGDHVTCRYWNDIWFNEGLASYSEAIWEERKVGSSGAPALQAAMNARKPASGAVSGTVYNFTTNNVNRLFDSDLTYDKAGWVWHMLRGQVGDATFWNILATIRSQFGGSAITTAQIESLCESVSGRDLTTFFNEWVYNGGAPTYVTGSQTFNVNGKSYARFHIRQSSVPTYQVFTTPIDVAIGTSAGTVTRRVQPLAATSWFVRSIPAPATSFTLDPSNWVLNYGKTGESYIQGPPVVLDAAPLPGASSEFRTAPSSVALTFSENMNVSPANFQVLRNGSPISFTYAWNATTLTATLGFDSRLSQATYAVNVVGAPTSAATAKVLDGEIATNVPSSLPSGNGQDGGAASFSFTVVPGSCPADLNNDNSVDDSDFVFFAGYYEQLLTFGGDIDGDGVTDDADFVLFADGYNALICP
ncbi:MAG TPA: M1 family aminopeptidase [Phycisphaerales bacterium]